MTVQTSQSTYPTGAGPMPVRITRPPGRGPFPAMIDVHGGAWTWFSPEVDFFWCRELARRGFVMVSPTFRTSLTAPWPACFDDVRAARAWVRTHAGELDVDPHRVGVIGGSTGGHLAAMLGMHVPDVAWVIALWPILDVEARYRMVRDARFSRLVERLAAPMQATPDGEATVRRLRRLDEVRRRAPSLFDPLGSLLQRLYATLGDLELSRALLFRALRDAHERTFRDVDTMRLASPVELLHSGDVVARPPMLIVQGDRDPNVTWAMTERFAHEYQMQGGPIELHLRRGLGHSYGNLPSREAEDLVELTSAFARRAA